MQTPENTAPLKLFTFTLTDGRKATYAAHTERQAFGQARDYHRHKATGVGVPTGLCACENKYVYSTRRAGWLICANCAGRVG